MTASTLSRSGKPTDIQADRVAVYFLPVQTRVPLKFGTETLTSVTCVRVRLEVRDREGRTAVGWGETPLSVQWAWPSRLEYSVRHEAMQQFCLQLAAAWRGYGQWGHPLELGHDFQHDVLPGLLAEFNQMQSEPMPHLAALICLSAFDIALHDAYGQVHGRDIYQMYGPEFLSRDLSAFLEPAAGSQIAFAGRYPEEFLVKQPPQELAAWHLVGGLDPLEVEDLTGDEPQDDYPVLLRDWIATDGLKCLKIKLRGNDAAWDYERLVRIGQISIETGVDWLTADFNCTVTDPQYVNAILDQLRDAHPRIYGMTLYVEQPFPYDLEANRIDVYSVSARKPLFLDESAHDWHFVRLGRELGWSGVALKTCKTQSGALLSLCWAKAHGMPVMVQDLTNPMLAQIPHVRLAAFADTIMGVETNAMQFYPDASHAEAQVHPGLYRRRAGQLQLETISGPGFGYRLDEIDRPLPEPAIEL